jgi:hypothetical protein
MHGSFLFEEFLKHPEALGEGAKQALDQETRSELVADLKTLAGELTAAASTTGATLRFWFLTPRGYEGYAYNYSREHRLDASQPLTVLNHVGGDPLGFLAVRGQFTLEDYERWVKWLGRGRYYFEKIGLKEMNERQQAAYKDLRRKTDPLLARLDQANRELLLPALEDGQKAIVFDASPHSAAQFVSEGQEVQEAASLEGALPWPEIAFVCGVSDAEKFKQGCQEYFAVIGEAWTDVRGFIEQVRAQVKSRSNASRVRLPELPTAEELRPTVQPVPQGEVFFYQLPERLSRSGRVAPNLALSEDFLALSYLPDYSLRLLEEQPFQGEGPLADLNRPLAAAAYLDFAGLIDALEPWLERGVERRQERRAQRQERSDNEESPKAAAPTPRAAAQSPSTRAPSTRAPSTRAPSLPTPPPQAAPRVATRRAPAQNPSPPTKAAPARVVREQNASVAEPLSPREAKEQLHLVLDLLRCFRGFASATYQEDDARVTHFELRFEDLRE